MTKLTTKHRFSSEVLVPCDISPGAGRKSMVGRICGTGFEPGAKQLRAAGQSEGHLTCKNLHQLSPNNFSLVSSINLIQPDE